MSSFSHVEITEKRRRVSRTANTSGLSDISKDYSQLTPPKTHKWTLEEQVTLILLVEKYENNWIEKKKIFNKYIEHELGSSHEFTQGALRSMYRELETRFRCPFGNWSYIGKALELQANLLSIPLINCAQPRTPSNLRQVNTGLPTPITNRKKYSQTRFPKLGFRAFDISNQGINSPTNFRAGRFVNANISAPPSPHSCVYRNDARRQIERVHEGLTPFISTTSSVLRALSYAYNRKHPSSTAIIDLHKAGKVEEYEDGSNPFLQNVYRLNLKPGDSYQGKSEFLVYGEIKKDAILCVVTLSQLVSRLPSLSNNNDPFGLRYLQPSEPLRESSECLCDSSECSCKSSKRLYEVRSLLRKKILPTNYSTGQIVGALLKALDMPGDYLNEGISIVALDWGLRKWRNNAPFKKGVANGFRENRFAKLPDLDLIGCSKLKATLREVTSITIQEKADEVSIYQDFEEMSWSSDIITENCCITQESPEFSFNEFMQELRNAAVISGPRKPSGMDMS